MKKFSYEDIDVILQDIVNAIKAIQKENNGFAETLTVYMPNYFRTVLNLYYQSKASPPIRRYIEFGDGSSFYGVKNFYPSPFNQIIISDLKAPQFNELTKIIEL
jgi:hypothetical protein